MKLAEKSKIVVGTLGDIENILQGASISFNMLETIVEEKERLFSWEEPKPCERKLRLELPNIGADTITGTVSFEKTTNIENPDVITTIDFVGIFNDDGAHIGDYVYQIRIKRSDISTIFHNKKLVDYPPQEFKMQNTLELVSMYKILPFEPLETIVENKELGFYENDSVTLPKWLWQAYINRRVSCPLVLNYNEWGRAITGSPSSLVFMHKRIKNKLRGQSRHQDILDEFQMSKFDTPVWYSKKERDSAANENEYWSQLIYKTNHNSRIDSHKLNDKWAIVSVIYDGYECYRVLLSQREIFFAIRSVDGTWREIPHLYQGRPEFMEGISVARMIDRRDLEGTLYQYWDKNLTDKELFNIILNPWIEAVKNGPMNKLYKKLISAYNPQDFMKSNFGACDFSQKQLHKMIGVNKYQYRAIINAMQNRRSYKNIILIKDVFGMDDISAIDNHTFDAWFKLISNHDVREVVKQVATAWGPPAALKMNKLVRTSRGTEQVRTIELLEDTIKMTTLMNINDDFRVTRIQTATELLRTHDALVIQMRYHDIDVKSISDNLGDMIKKWKRYEYKEKDSPFVVVAPKCYYDIIQEGLILHHCVASYVPEVSKGRTNIVFIRKKDDVDKPFYTAEIRTANNNLRQVHGLFNKYAHETPDLVDFIKRWCINRDIRIDNYDAVLNP